MKKSRNNTTNPAAVHTTNPAAVLRLTRSSWNEYEGRFVICPVLVPLASVKFISKAEISERFKEKPHVPKSWVYFSSGLDYGVTEDLCTIERLIHE